MIGDDISIVLPAKAVPKDFVLLHNADHGSTVNADLTPVQRAAVATWPPAAVELGLGDLNLDGATDVLIKGLPSVTGAFDQIVFASPTRGRIAPLINNMVDDDVRLFFKTVHDWMLNPDTLSRNQYKVVGIEPASKTWVAFFYHNDPAPAVITHALGLCPSGRSCGLSNSKPLGACVKIVNRYDDDGNYIDTGPEDVCQYSLHVWAYDPGSIVLAEDATFHQDAVDFVDLLHDVAYGNVTNYIQIVNSLSVMNAYLGVATPIGTSAQQCEDGPAVNRLGYTNGLGPLVVPVGYGVYYCALGAVVVATAAITLIDDLLDAASETTVFSNGNATTPAPYSHAEEQEARQYMPDPFGDNCDPPRGNGQLKHQINVLRAQIAWRYTDLNPLDKVGYPAHRNHILFLEEDLKVLEERYRNICGGEP